MKTYSFILQGCDATEENAIWFASEYSHIIKENTEEYKGNVYHQDYIDTINGIDIYYNIPADYYFFAPAD